MARVRELRNKAVDTGIKVKLFSSAVFIAHESIQNRKNAYNSQGKLLLVRHRRQLKTFNCLN